MPSNVPPTLCACVRALSQRESRLHRAMCTTPSPLLAARAFTGMSGSFENLIALSPRTSESALLGGGPHERRTSTPVLSRGSDGALAGLASHGSEAALISMSGAGQRGVSEAALLGSPGMRGAADHPAMQPVGLTL